MNPSRTPSHRSAEIYREAARLLEIEATHSETYEGKVSFTCCAIAEAGGFFAAWNRPRDPLEHWSVLDDYLFTFTEPGVDLQLAFENNNEGVEPRDVRILALCFMAAITERP